MKSFSILKTNVGLTTNVKVTIQSNYKLSLDSINSNSSLEQDKLKNYKFNNNSYYDEILSSFYKDIPKDISYSIKNSNNKGGMLDSFKNQYDDIYDYGAKDIRENKFYNENYEYFAPLYIINNKLPSNFIIFRIDGSGIKSIDKNNFNIEVLRKLKCIKLFDLTEKSNLGKWIDKNFVSNKHFPNSPLKVNFKKLNFSKWYGIDYNNGGYTSKSVFMENDFKSENEIYELEKNIFNKYKDNDLIFPNIINFNFLFNDKPSDSINEKKWSINRYLGFYIDELKLEKTISPYITPILKNDVKILDNNILSSQSSDNPFVKKWSEKIPFYVEYNGNYLLVKRILEDRVESIERIKYNDYIDEEYTNKSIYKYKIISKFNLKDKQSQLNNNYGYIDNNNCLKTYNNENIVISNFEKSSVWLIEIDGIYHNIIKDDDNNLKLNTDYVFDFKTNAFSYTIRSITKNIDIDLTFNKTPVKFKIYRVNFTDIKNFDNKIVDTEYSKYEYEKESYLTNTDEPKMYFEKDLDELNPKEIDTYIYNDEKSVIPVSSEYTSNYETFKLVDNKLSDIWKINSDYCRWGLQGSNGPQNMPYLLNNSLVFEQFNKSPNTFTKNVDRSERNLDYFYTINSDSLQYTNHSLHIEDTINDSLNTDYYFNINTYLSNDFDYFTYFFEKPVFFNNLKEKKNSKKYSFFNSGDNVIPNTTNFKGIEFNISNVDKISINDFNEIKSINTLNKNTFNNYKFSILLSETSNSMQWKIINYWKMNVSYKQDDIVIFDDILYRAKKDNKTTKPEIKINFSSRNNNLEQDLDDANERLSGDSFEVGNPNRVIINRILSIRNVPYNNTEDWEIYTNEYVKLWNPMKEDYVTGDIIYNNDEYYYCYSNDENDYTCDIWNPFKSYDKNNLVIYKGDYYQSNINNNQFNPKTISSWKKINKGINIVPKWKKIQIWNPSIKYDINSLVIHNKSVYKENDNRSEIGDEPGKTLSWRYIYSVEKNDDYIYKPDDNPFIFMNNTYYLLTQNNEEKTLDNGINIYINKKWKNILINVFFNDNTLPNLKNNNRDDIYNELYEKLTASNFIDAINDLSNKYDFSNYLTYYIINENGDIQSYNYNDNIEKLPFIIYCSTPDKLNIKNNSLIKKALKNKIIPNKKLKNNIINNISELNWYNIDIPISYSIENNDKNKNTFKNYNAGTNIEYFSIYRYSGYYMPIFYDIELFNRENIDNIGSNYLFDTNLLDFGLIKEKKFNKSNRNGSILKLRNSNENKSIYPMIDEYLYSYNDFMIFKSPLDFEYYNENISNINSLKNVIKKETFYYIGQSLKNKNN